MVKTHRKQTISTEQNKPVHVPLRPISVKKRLKPIKNRHLISNPYVVNAEQYFAKKLRKLPSIAEVVPSGSSSNSDSSEHCIEPEETEQLCTLRELLDLDRYCFCPSS